MRTKILIRNFIPKFLLKYIKSSFYFIRKLIYHGNEMLCPTCNNTYSKFLNYCGRKNAMCPGCASLERHRLLYLYMKKETNLLSKKNRILHFAPEYSLQKKFKEAYKQNYLSADLEHPYAMAHFDITKIPYKNDSFNIIICNYVLQEVKQDYLAIKELFRVLKKGGTLITITPVDEKITKTKESEKEESNKERVEKYGYCGAVRTYGKDFFNKLSDVGFKVKIINPLKIFSKKEFRKYGLNNEKIYVCKK